MKPIIFPYQITSQGAKELAKELKTICVRTNGHYRPERNHLLINWGNAGVPKSWRLQAVGRILNSLGAVGVAHQKLHTFKQFSEKGIRCPNWTTSMEIARKWIREGKEVLERHLLTSSEGRGARLVNSETALKPSPLYVEYKKKVKEFRVHVFRGQVIDVQQKRRAQEHKEDADTYIRSYTNGWIFARQNIVEPKTLRPLAIAAVQACGLDFGAVDIIWNKKEDQCYALEVNTAPGIEGTTVLNYARAIRAIL